MHYTPNYLFSPWAPRKMAAALRLQSEALVRLVRFVVILRGPSRARSRLLVQGRPHGGAGDGDLRAPDARARADRPVRARRSRVVPRAVGAQRHQARAVRRRHLPGHFERLQLLQHIDKGISPTSSIAGSPTSRDARSTSPRSNASTAAAPARRAASSPSSSRGWASPRCHTARRSSKSSSPCGRTRAATRGSGRSPTRTPPNSTTSSRRTTRASRGWARTFSSSLPSGGRRRCR